MAKDEIIIDPSIMESIFAHEDRYFQVPSTRLDQAMDVVEAMSDPHRSVVELIVWGRHSKAEAARELGFSRQYVHKVWAEAQEMLKVELATLLEEE